MDFILRRHPSNEKCTIGELYLDGSLVCFTLEDVVREVADTPVVTWKVPHETAIPQGRYRITLTMSKRFGRVLPLVNNVENFEGVRIHPGNVAENTEGCLLPGMAIGPNDESVLESRRAMQKVYDIVDNCLRDGRDVFIDVRNG